MSIKLRMSPAALADNIILFRKYHMKYPSHNYRWLNAKIRLDIGLKGSLYASKNYNDLLEPYGIIGSLLRGNKTPNKKLLILYHITILVSSYFSFCSSTQSVRRSSITAKGAGPIDRKNSWKSLKTNLSPSLSFASSSRFSISRYPNVYSI